LNETDQRYTPNLFDSPEAIARHLLEIEKNETGVVNKDSARANLNPIEMKTVRALGGLINEIEYAEQITGFDLSELKNYYINELATTNVPSRSKSGFAIVLSKTDRRVNTNEINDLAQDISEQFSEEKKPGIFGKLFKKKVPEGGQTNG
jgi:hypothetical protein